MREFDNDPAISQTVELMNSYGLDLRGHTTQEIISQLLDKYQANWIRLATIEALYLGRYKVISIEQILSVWLRLGNPNPHFSHEFERLICRKLPRNPTYLLENTSVTPSLEEKILEEEIAALGQNKSITPASLASKPQKQSDETLEKNSENSSSSLSETPQANEAGLAMPAREERARSNSEQPTIGKFTPIPDASPFYNKLKSLAEEKLEEE